MLGADNLGLAKTAGVEAKFYPVIPPVQRIHQEGVVDTIIVAYDEPETGEMIPVGRVITSPSNLTWDQGKTSFPSSTVRGLVGDGVIYAEHNQPLRPEYAEKQAENLLQHQEAAAKMILGHFGYSVKRKRSTNVLVGLLRKVR